MNRPPNEPATSIFSQVAEWVPNENREEYWRFVAHLRKLPADDEILRICQAMGVLAVVTRGVPRDLAIEREKWFKEVRALHTEGLQTMRSSLVEMSGWSASATKIALQLHKTSDVLLEAVRAVEASIRSAPGRLDFREMEQEIDQRMEELALRPLQKAVEGCNAAMKALEAAGQTAENRIARWHDFNQQTVWDQATIWAVICYALSMILTVALIGVWLMPIR